MRILIVDDEPLALDRLSDLLGQIKEVDVVGVCNSGSQALESIAQLRPDLVLLDIEMPRIDGFDVVEAIARRQLRAEPPPLICFVTAYPHFAIDAFETGALDFLCKPVRLQRLAKALTRARDALNRREAERRLGELSRQLNELRLKQSSPDDRTIWVHKHGDTVRVPVSTIDWLKSESEYVRLHCGSKSYLVRNSLNSIVADLAIDDFLRIHRSFAINGRRLEAVRRRPSGMKVLLDVGVELPVGRKFRELVVACYRKTLY